MRALSKEWDVKTVSMQESKDLNEIELHNIFSDLKSYEFELKTRTNCEYTSHLTKHWLRHPMNHQSRKRNQLSSKAKMLCHCLWNSLASFWERNKRTFKVPAKEFYHKKEFTDEDNACFNCRKVVNFIPDFPKPKKDDLRPTDKDRRSFDKKKSSMDDKMSFKKKKDQDVLVAEDINAKWVDSDSGSSESDSASNSNDEEEA